MSRLDRGHRPDLDGHGLPGGHDHPPGHDRRGPDQHGPDRHGPDQHGPDHRGPDHRGPDRRGPNRRGPDRRGPDQHGPEHHGPEHAHGRGVAGLLRAVLAPHSHDAAESVDQALTSSDSGMRCLAVSLALLAATAVIQTVIVLFSGSVALLGDTIHNFADALTAVPLGVAFWLQRKPPTRRYTFGYGRAEDLAGAFIVAGNELVALYRVRVGRRIGSAALVADGRHARADGVTSLAVVAGAIGVAAGWRQADPVAGLLITIAVLAVLKNAARDIYRRLMDSVDPALVDQVERVLCGVYGVLQVKSVRIRWVGHVLQAEATVVSDRDLTLGAAHAISEEAHHRLLHEVSRLGEALIHSDPSGQGRDEPHALTAHHFARQPGR
jgi:divalent metal cation (Fe/Co/Zn/Cd) transporter